MKWIKTHVGRDVEPWQCNRTDCVSLIGKSPYEEINDYVYERESNLAAAEVPGAANALRALTVIGDVFVVTNRRLHRIAYAREWLERMGLALSIREVITSHDSSKEQVCHQIGAHVLIDDDVRHLRDVRLGDCGVSGCNGRTQTDDCPMGVRSAATGTGSWGCWRVWLTISAPDRGSRCSLRPVTRGSPRGGRRSQCLSSATEIDEDVLSAVSTDAQSARASICAPTLDRRDPLSEVCEINCPLQFYVTKSDLRSHAKSCRWTKILIDLILVL